MVENRCYDADCEDEKCHNPQHYNYICFDPDCEEVHCTDSNHYDKQLLRDYQENSDLSIYDHREEIDYDEDVDINICGCPDCADDDHDHEHDHDHHHEHEEADSCSDPDCGCHDEHDHEHEHHHDHDHGHDHHHEHDHGHEHHHGHDHGHDYHHEHEVKDACSDPDCDCHDHDHDDDVEISICGCPDCADDDHDHDDHDHGSEELLAEGKPLIANRPIQIIVASGICFAAGHILELLSVNPTIVTLVFMVGALIAGYEIAILAYKSLVKRHTIGPAMLMCIACVASFIIGHPEEGAAVTFLYYIAEFLEDYAEHRAKRSIKSLVEIAPETARVKAGNTEEIKKVDDVNVGEIVIVKPGIKCLWMEILFQGHHQSIRLPLLVKVCLFIRKLVMKYFQALSM